MRTKLPDARERRTFDFFGALERHGRCFCPSTIRAIDERESVALRDFNGDDAFAMLHGRVPPSDATAAAIAYLAHMIDLYGGGGGASGIPRAQYAVIGFNSSGFAQRYGADTPLVFAYGRADEARLVIGRASEAALPLLSYVGDAPLSAPVSCAIDRLRFGKRLARFRAKPIPPNAIVFLADAESTDDRDRFVASAAKVAGNPIVAKKGECTVIVKPPPDSSVAVPAAPAALSTPK